MPCIHSRWQRQEDLHPPQPPCGARGCLLSKAVPGALFPLSRAPSAAMVPASLLAGAPPSDALAQQVAKHASLSNYIPRRLSVQVTTAARQHLPWHAHTHRPVLLGRIRGPQPTCCCRWGPALGPLRRNHRSMQLRSARHPPTAVAAWVPLTLAARHSSRLSPCRPRPWWAQRGCWRAAPWRLSRRMFANSLR
jgi:hypothetical protein